MTIQNLKDLEKLIKLCRKHGLVGIEVDGIKLELGKYQPKVGNAPILTDFSGDFPEAGIPVPQYTGEIEAPTAPTTADLTPEQLLFYSAQGHNELEQQ